MNDKKILSKLNEFESAEEAYRKLYLANPYDDIPPVRNWEDFAAQYKKNMKNSVEIPTEPISDISTYFYESQFFSPQTLVPQTPSPNAFEMVYPPVANSECVFSNICAICLYLTTLWNLSSWFMLSRAAAISISVITPIIFPPEV